MEPYVVILIVDDDPSLRRMLARMLQHLGREVAVAASGAEALVLCRERLPRLILIDERMPTMRGHQLIRLLRREFGEHCPRVVLLTGGDADVSNAAEIDGILPKPFFLEDLRALLERWG